MADVPRVKDQSYILAPTSLSEERTQVLKHADTFGVFDRYGDILPVGLGEQGLYHEGTRFLSRMELLAGEKNAEARPLLLGSMVSEDNGHLAVNLTNPDMGTASEVKLPRETLHISRTRFLWERGSYERVRIRNYGDEAFDLSVRFRFEADFADIFEVRGMKRERRGHMLEPSVNADTIVLAYLGLDGIPRRTRLEFSPEPDDISASDARFAVRLEPRGEATVFLTVRCESGDAESNRDTYTSAYSKASEVRDAHKARVCEITSSNKQFDEWMRRSAADIDMMTTDTPYGPYPYAGVPWFCTVFGRDGIITAMECLWFNPDLAKGVLGYLASTQATEDIPEREAEPGKILHETRHGEMAALGEVPFGRYYGSVDGTPLFVMLAGEYYERTGDLAFIKTIWSNIDRALQWIDVYGDLDGDGFVEYQQRSPSGGLQQGWKDSEDSVFHRDGRAANGPIALCEVQGYVYAAKQNAAVLAELLGLPEKAEKLHEQAATLKEKFERSFWCDELSTYALALDGDKRQCRVRTSNAGHALFSEIASPEHARLVAKTLFGTDSFSGWGIRTVAASEARYNPISYHNGSVWPHDNVMIARGLARPIYAEKDGAVKILDRLFDASRYMDLPRLPELFCGFDRREGEGPIRYPVANSPQSWAAAAVFSLLQSCLGLTIYSDVNIIEFSHPRLPDFLDWVEIKNLKVGEGSVSLKIIRAGNDALVERTGKQDPVRIRVNK